MIVFTFCFKKIRLHRDKIIIKLFIRELRFQTAVLQLMSGSEALSVLKCQREPFVSTNYSWLVIYVCSQKVWNFSRVRNVRCRDCDWFIKGYKLLLPPTRFKHSRSKTAFINLMRPIVSACVVGLQYCKFLLLQCTVQVDSCAWKIFRLCQADVHLASYIYFVVAINVICRTHVYCQRSLHRTSIRL